METKKSQRVHLNTHNEVVFALTNVLFIFVIGYTVTGIWLFEIKSILAIFFVGAFCNWIFLSCPFLVLVRNRKKKTSNDCFVSLEARGYVEVMPELIDVINGLSISIRK